METIQLQNKEIFISEEVMEAIRRKDRIEWAKGVLQTHDTELPKALEDFSDVELDEYGKALDAVLTLSSNSLESQLILEMFEDEALC